MSLTYLERHPIEGPMACQRCGGRGNELWSMYKACGDCHGYGRAPLRKIACEAIHQPSCRALVQTGASCDCAPVIQDPHP